MVCEKCGAEHNGAYASGRFCSEKCSRSFSADCHREETNKKVSATLIEGFRTGRIKANGFIKGHKFASSTREKRIKSLLKTGELTHKKHIENWKLGLETGNRKGSTRLCTYVDKYIRDKFDNKCVVCGWNKLNPSSNISPLEINHRDGNRKNSAEDNLELLCPNCHSLTPRYRNHGGHRGRHKKVI